MRKKIIISSLLAFCASPLNAAENWYAEGLRAEASGKTAVAIEFYSKSADEQNLSDAMFALGRLYRDVYSDLDTSLAWYTKASEHGNAFAQLELGLLYSNGSHITIDKDLARYWLEKSFNNGARKEAAWSLFHLSHTEPEKLIWLKRAAESGYQEAMYLLSNAYSSGELGLDIDESQSSYWRDLATIVEE